MMKGFRRKLAGGGRVQVPAKIRRDFGLEEGDAVVLSVVDGEIRVRKVEPADCGDRFLSQQDREWLDGTPVGREII